MENLIISLFIGAVAGWIAGNIMKGGGFGIIGNIVIGILGAVFGSFLFDLMDIYIGGSRIVSGIITATFGAVVLLFLIGLVKKV